MCGFDLKRSFREYTLLILEKDGQNGRQTNARGCQYYNLTFGSGELIMPLVYPTTGVNKTFSIVHSLPNFSSNGFTYTIYTTNVFVRFE